MGTHLIDDPKMASYYAASRPDAATNALVNFYSILFHQVHIMIHSSAVSLTDDVLLKYQAARSDEAN